MGQNHTITMRRLGCHNGNPPSFKEALKPDRAKHQIVPGKLCGPQNIQGITIIMRLHTRAHGRNLKNPRRRNLKNPQKRTCWINLGRDLWVMKKKIYGKQHTQNSMESLTGTMSVPGRPLGMHLHLEL